MSVEDDCYRFVQLVVIKEHPFCRICGAPATVGHHLYKRDRMATAFLPEAIWALCHYCHDWAHRNPFEFQKKVIEEIVERYYELLRLSNSVIKNQDLKSIREDLRKRAKK